MADERVLPMDADMKRQLKDEYKQKLTIGAVYVLECSGNHRRWIRSTTNIQGIRNRFQFSASMKVCPDPVTRSDCDQYGWDSISLAVLEELQMREDQTAGEFSEEIKLLQELWTQKLLSDETRENDVSNMIRINQFLDGEGRIIQLPKKHSTKCAVLAYLAGKFEPGAQYTEHQVNDVCNSWHTFGDPCLIRRELVDSGLLGRESDCS